MKRLLWFSLCVALLPVGFAAEMIVTGIAVPFHDERGVPTHRLEAKRGQWRGAERQLEGVEIVYFAKNDPQRIVQRLKADEAIWNEREETLTGRGHVEVETEQSRLEGEGFDLALATSQLRIHRAFRLETRDLTLTSRRAIVDLVIERSGDEVAVRDVKRCEAIDGVEIVVRPAAMERFHFDRALTDIAIYDGATQEVVMPKPIRYFRAGRPAGGTGTARFPVKR